MGKGRSGQSRHTLGYLIHQHGTVAEKILHAPLHRLPEHGGQLIRKLQKIGFQGGKAADGGLLQLRQHQCDRPQLADEQCAQQHQQAGYAN